MSDDTLEFYLSRITKNAICFAAFLLEIKQVFCLFS